MDDWRAVFSPDPDALAHAPRGWLQCGSVREVRGVRVDATGCAAAIGEACRLLIGGIETEALGFADGRALLMPTRTLRGVRPGDPVRPLGRTPSVRIGASWLGRVVNAMGEPLDGGPPLGGSALRPLDGAPPPPLARGRIRKPLTLGIRVLDACLPVGEGQRIGLFAGPGVGKSTLLGMIARHARADVFVIALVGERGREVREFIEDALDEEARRRAVVVVATAEEPAQAIVRAAKLALAVGEYFRDQGRHVVLLMDSLTRLARAQRELGLLLGEPPAQKGYTPSCFRLLGELIERAGPGPNGALSAVFTVLVEGADPREDPVAEAAMAVLDGHIVLSPRLAERGRWPAVDLGQSTSRLAAKLMSEQQRRDAEVLRKALAHYEEAADLIAIGAYQAGSDPWVDRVLAHRAEVERFLAQRPDEHALPDESARSLHALAQKLNAEGAHAGSPHRQAAADHGKGAGAGADGAYAHPQRDPAHG